MSDANPTTVWWRAGAALAALAAAAPVARLGADPAASGDTGAGP